MYEMKRMFLINVDFKKGTVTPFDRAE